jgi:hypothetical protein
MAAASQDALISHAHYFPNDLFCKRREKVIGVLAADRLLAVGGPARRIFHVRCARRFVRKIARTEKHSDTKNSPHKSCVDSFIVSTIYYDIHPFYSTQHAKD